MGTEADPYISSSTARSIREVNLLQLLIAATGRGRSVRFLFRLSSWSDQKESNVPNNNVKKEKAGRDFTPAHFLRRSLRLSRGGGRGRGSILPLQGGSFKLSLQTSHPLPFPQTPPTSVGGGVGCQPRMGLHPIAQGCCTQLPWELRRIAVPTLKGLRPSPSAR